MTLIVKTSKRTILQALPNELILYLVGQFLDLNDVWQLYQTSQELRVFAYTVITTNWKIEMSCMMKIQCRSVLLKLEKIPLTSDNMIQFLTITTNIKQETKIHEQMIQGIVSYKHQYVLIEDIDIRNRIRTAVDVIFHHAVFVSHGEQAAALFVRLLTKLDIAFPSYCREITFTLADNMKAFLEYTSYKLMSTSNHTVVLSNIKACFDLMGAAFIVKLLNDTHLDSAITRTCELLQHHAKFKKKLFLGLLNHWLTMKRELDSSELCRLIRVEMNK